MFLPHIKRWRLSVDGEPIITHSSHLLPVSWDGKPAMLKISSDAAERAGGALMQWWDGVGAARVYAHDSEAVLLERAMGRRSLLAMAMDGADDTATRIICSTVAKLHAPRERPRPELIPLARWFRDLAPAADVYGGILARCNLIAAALLADNGDPVVLHGDIHHNNILDFEQHGWLAIDPKGLIGERGFDYANIFVNQDLPTTSTPGRLRRQLGIVATKAGLEPKRLLQWIAAYSGLSAAWFLGDGSTELAESPLAAARIALAELQQG
ncbi:MULTISPECIES: aminoglycoside phosphotransferase family protein [Rhizobium]|uniref:Aminoglycoside/hydroxyurea antibiotic resistance kinase n=1 Tax=Rhizobium favelukesii TaxID=348824 RepID=W6RE14_9HYPH|nr:MULTISPECIES: aminoglycoside phosphotransferase family protein [Rhizobium]MCS0460416.1 3'-kinase [Rhizobium favelukesii]UFS83840.1 3'-kinase [Rhizobium sp. T136]CDM58535.1 aminoglycoside/hydroxyurea antibiotic resistance kinase [Rhizobium favelukesii]